MSAPLLHRPATRADLLARLSELGIPAETFEHAAVFTVGDSLELQRTIPGGHTKNLFLKDKKGQLFLVVALHDAAIDLKYLHKPLGSGRLSFGSGELLLEVLGIKPGSVTPLALINDRARRVTVVLDHVMMQYDQLNFHPLENTATTGIARDDVLRFIRACGHEPRVMDIRAPAAGHASTAMT